MRSSKDSWHSLVHVLCTRGSLGESVTSAFHFFRLGTRTEPLPPRIMRFDGCACEHAREFKRSFPRIGRGNRGTGSARWIVWYLRPSGPVPSVAACGKALCIFTLACFVEGGGGGNFPYPELATEAMLRLASFHPGQSTVVTRHCVVSRPPLCAWHSALQRREVREPSESVA